MTLIDENFHSPADRELLEFNELGNFINLWEAEFDWFEPPNYRRSGWSGAARYELHRENGEVVGVFIKRQENHLRRTWRYPKGCPTFRIEWQNLEKLTQYQVGVPAPLYYGERHLDGRPQAILITYELQGYKPLNEWLCDLDENRENTAATNKDLRLAVLPAIADVVRSLHDHRFRHNCLYPKHVMLKVRQ
ncbi:lipopolysaccharide kinase, partial [bacterium]|nr:lipopolysaccharide kinase [bacterium]